MRVLCVVHQPDAGPGAFVPVLTASGHEIEEWRPDRRSRPSAPPYAYGAVLTFGGAMHVDQEERHRWLRAEKELLAELLERDTPVLGVCLGAQLLAEAGDGRARPATAPEIGWHELELSSEGADDPLLSALPSRFQAFEWHSYVIDPPPGAAALALSECCLQAFRAGERAWGIQFHAEVTHDGVAGWVAKDGDEGELRGAGIDPAALMAQTRRRIDDSQRLGAKICERFVALAEEAPGAAQRRRACGSGRVVEEPRAARVRLRRLEQTGRGG